MNRADTIAALARVRAARKRRDTILSKLNADIDRVMRRLVHEAAANYMSAEDVSRLSGFNLAWVRTVMRQSGLSPRGDRTLIARKAAKVLADNAELLGIEPRDMDLTSPLAYLPAGKNLRRETSGAVSVTEFPETPEEAWDQFAKSNDYDHPEDYDYIEQRRFWLMGYKTARGIE